MNQYSFKVKDDLSGANPPDAKAVAVALGYAALGAADFRVEYDPVNEVYGVTVVMPTRIPPNVVGAASLAPGIMTLADNNLTQELTNQQRVVVRQGDFICVVWHGAYDPSSELVMQRSIIMKSGSGIAFGFASQSAEMGIYDTPFSAAMAHANFGPIVVRGNEQPVEVATEPSAPSPVPIIRTANIVSNSATRIQ